MCNNNNNNSNNIKSYYKSNKKREKNFKIYEIIWIWIEVGVNSSDDKYNLAAIAIKGCKYVLHTTKA